MAAGTEPSEAAGTRWFSQGVAGIGASSFPADVGHEVPTALLPSLLTATLHAPASPPRGRHSAQIFVVR
jgi:hypothetical protein